MRTDFAINLANYLIEEFAPKLLEQGWRIEIVERPQRRLGQCCYTNKLITLSEKFVLLNPAPRIEDCTKHEIAHALVGPGHGHNEIWKHQARKLGIEPNRCDSISVQSPGKWQAICPGCTRVYPFYRKPDLKKLRWCAKCGRIRGQLTITLTPQTVIDEES